MTGVVLHHARSKIFTCKLSIIDYQRNQDPLTRRCRRGDSRVTRFVATSIRRWQNRPRTNVRHRSYEQYWLVLEWNRRERTRGTAALPHSTDLKTCTPVRSGPLDPFSLISHHRCRFCRPLRREAEDRERCARTSSRRWREIVTPATDASHVNSFIFLYFVTCAASPRLYLPTPPHPTPPRPAPPVPPTVSPSRRSSLTLCRFFFSRSFLAHERRCAAAVFGMPDLAGSSTNPRWSIPSQLTCFFLFLFFISFFHFFNSFLYQ